MNNNNMINLSPQAIQKAAAAGAKLLNTDGAVQVDGPMALSGDLQILNIILKNLENGSIILASPKPPELPEAETPEESDPDIPPEG